MARQFRQPSKPQNLTQPTQPDPVSQALTDRYLSHHATEGQPAPRGPRLQEQIDNSIANTPGIVTRDGTGGPASVAPDYLKK